MKTFQFTIQLSVLKPIREVYDAVVNPKKLSGYFVETASGPLKAGTKVTWRFPEFPLDIFISVKKAVSNKEIRFDWEAQDGGYNTHVTFTFKALNPKTTVVKIKESGWRPNEKGRASSYGNCSGWMNMLCCLKAYLEYRVNLRKGAFLGMKFPESQ